MSRIYLGINRVGKKVYLDSDILKTHLHLVGATGAGKTTAIHTLLRPLMMNSREKCTLFVIDPIGNLSQDLLSFIANERHCPQHVRDRLLYIEPARLDHIVPFNPLASATQETMYYQTMRSVDIVLRAWAATDVSTQPRLLQWTYKAFCAAASMGMPISMCRYLVHPGTEEHKAILRAMPPEIASHWSQILSAHGGEATRILESTRNRMDPFFENLNLRRMFGSPGSRFDCERMIRERKIVILNVAKYGRLPEFIGSTIGALALNEVLETANRLSTTEGRSVVEPTYVLMDEFQSFVGTDVEQALPTVRQMGLRFILAHQSFAQLEREDVDLTQMIWQARSRMMFCNYAKDADILSDELAKLSYDPEKIKHLITSKRQLITGYRKEWLESVSRSTSSSTSVKTENTRGYGFVDGSSRKHGSDEWPTRNDSRSRQDGSSKGEAEMSGATDSQGRSQTVIPIHNNFEEVSSVTFESFEECALQWGKTIRQLTTGQALAQMAGDPAIHQLAVDYFPVQDSQQLLDAKAALLEQNFASDFFISGEQAERESEQFRQRLVSGSPIILSSPKSEKPLLTLTQEAEPESDSEDVDPFRK